MKILFFTPALLDSAIGRVSKLVVAALQQQGHDVVVVRTEEPALFEKTTHSFQCSTIHWNDARQVLDWAAQSDLVVYQIGNHFPYHCGCLEWMEKLPGLVSLHDNFLGHLFWTWSERMGRPQALELLTALYGSEIANQFFNHASSDSFIAYTSEFAPMTEWISSMASAVIVHSSWATDRIVRTCPGPVEVVPLPYDAPFMNVVASKEVRSKDDGRVVVLTIGHVNRNKRYESVIKAIGSNARLRERMTFRIVGSVEPAMAQELASLAESLSVDVDITGAVDDQQLAAEIHHADIMSCLRWPALEAASASTIEAMLYGKPIIVTDTGFYRDLPDDCVLKVSPEDELGGLCTALDELLASPQERDSLGTLARAYAVKTFRADQYANHVASMKQRMARAKIVADAAQVFSGTLHKWGAQGDKAIMAAIATPLDFLS